MAHSRAGAPFSFLGVPLTVQLLRSTPKQIVAGDSIEFLVAIPTDLTGYTGSARLTGPSVMDGSVATESTDYHVTFSGQTATGTKLLVAGQYILTVWAKSGNDRYTVYQAPVTVVADLSVGTPTQSHARRMLAAIETAIYNRLTGNTDGGIESYAIDGVSISKLSMEQLEKMRARYSAEVSAQQNPDAPFGSVKAVFTPAGSAVGLMRRYS